MNEITSDELNNAWDDGTIDDETYALMAYFYLKGVAEKNAKS